MNEKIIANDIRVGNVLEHAGKLWTVLKTQVVKPGKGGAFMQVEMKDFLGGSKLNERFDTGETVEKVRLEERPYQYLYESDGNAVLMDQENYEQIELPRGIFGDAAVFLQEGITVTIEMHGEKPLRGALPDSMVFTIAEAEPVVKGQTAASSYKPAILENGVRVMVPPFIEAGTKIVIKTEDGSYVERAK